MMLTFFIICIYVNYYFGYEGFNNKDNNTLIGTGVMIGLLILGFIGSMIYAFYGPSQTSKPFSNYVRPASLGSPANYIPNWGTTKAR